MLQRAMLRVKPTPRPLQLRLSLLRHQANKSQVGSQEDDLDPANCPIFTSGPSSPKELPAAPSKTLRLFRMVPKDVVQSIHSLYWILIGGPVPRHLQERSFAMYPSVEMVMLRLGVRLTALLLCGFGGLCLVRTCIRRWHCNTVETTEE